MEEKKIEELKERYGALYATTISGDRYIFRPLTRNDYQDIMISQASDPDVDQEYEIFKKCVVSDYDEKILTQKPGIITVISEKIMISSGFEAAPTEEL